MPPSNTRRIFKLLAYEYLARGSLATRTLLVSSGDAEQFGINTNEALYAILYLAAQGVVSLEEIRCREPHENVAEALGSLLLDYTEGYLDRDRTVELARTVGDACDGRIVAEAFRLALEAVLRLCGKGVSMERIERRLTRLAEVAAALGYQLKPIRCG